MSVTGASQRELLVSRQLMLYIVSGLLAVATHLIVLTLLVELWDAPGVVASAAGFSAAIPVHFLFQKYFVFQSNAPAMAQFGRYILVTLGMLALNTILFFILSRTTALNYLIVQCLVTGVVFAANFAINRTYTFRGKSDGASG